MTEAFLKNPLSLFDIKGKTAIVTGASGAFGALAAQVPAGAGARFDHKQTHALRSHMRRYGIFNQAAADAATGSQRRKKLEPIILDETWLPIVKKLETRVD